MLKLTNPFTVHSHIRMRRHTCALMCCVCVYVCLCVCVCVCVCLCIWPPWIMSFLIKLSMRNERTVVTKLFTNKLSEITRLFQHIQRRILISELQNRLGNFAVSVWSIIVFFFTPYLFSFFTHMFRSVTSLLRISDSKILFSSSCLAFVVHSFNMNVIGSSTVLLIWRHLQLHTDCLPFLRSR